jgi:hypothetical protein
MATRMLGPDRWLFRSRRDRPCSRQDSGFFPKGTAEISVEIGPIPKPGHAALCIRYPAPPSFRVSIRSPGVLSEPGTILATFAIATASPLPLHVRIKSHSNFPRSPSAPQRSPLWPGWCRYPRQRCYWSWPRTRQSQHLHRRASPEPGRTRSAPTVLIAKQSPHIFRFYVYCTLHYLIKRTRQHRRRHRRLGPENGHAG